jgi:hypothetical protein
VVDEARTEHLQDRLLDEAIEHRRDSELARTAARLRDLVAPYRLRLVRAREELLADPRPVRAQVRAELVHRHPIDARAAPVLSHAPQRSQAVAALDHLLDQVARSRALGLVRRRWRFVTARPRSGFTARSSCSPRSRGLLTRSPVESHRLTLPLVRPFVAVRRDYYGLC